MIAIPVASRFSTVSSVRDGLPDCLERHPEWWTLLLSAVAWATLGMSIQRPFAIPVCSSAVGAINRALVDFRVAPRLVGIAPDYLCWMLMAPAMMLPLTIPAVRHVAFRTFVWRCNRAIAAYLLGYLALWMLAGALLSPLATIARLLDPDGLRLALTLGLLAIAIWQITPIKLRALRRCHRTIPLASSGWRADLDCFRYGLDNGAACVSSCWVLMFVGALAMRSLPIVILTQAIMLNERYGFSPRVNRALPKYLITAGALFSLILPQT